MVQIAVVLIVLWLVGLLVFKALGAIVHIALLVGLVLLVLHFVRRRRIT